MTKKEGFTFHTPHDRFFRHAMSDKRVSEEFLRRRLPPELKALVDFNTLEQTPKSFVSHTLARSESDMVFRMKLQDASTSLYVLVEHMSTVDPLMPLRLVDYNLSILKQHARQFHTKSVPLVYSMLFYTGTRSYTGPTDLAGVFEAHNNMGKNMLIDAFNLTELHRIQDEALIPHLWSGTMELVFKHSAEKNTLDGLKRIEANLKRLKAHESGELFMSVINYILSQTDLEERNDVLKFIGSIGYKNVEGEIMTIAEYYTNQGRQEGRQEGVQKGRQSIACNMLRDGMDKPAVSKFTELTLEDLEALEMEL